MMQAFRLLALAWTIIIGLAVFINIMSGDWNQITEILPINRVLASICLLGIIIWCFYEFGWMGGHKDKASHM